MKRSQYRSIHYISISLSSGGIFLLFAGIIIGWIAPWASQSISPLHIFRTPFSTIDKIDINGFLGADITSLAVIIAVLIGYNASTLQIAGQLLSPALVRAILLSLAPFLICWSVNTFVVLAYFLIPPTLIAQLAQLVLWFVAVVLFMIAYLWNLPWRLSGEYAALWAIRELQSKPIHQWESIDGYSVLRTGVATAAARADLSTVRSMTMAVGSFLASRQDRQGELANYFDRERYRTLKNLLSGCSQNLATAPHAVAYYVGFVAAGVLLQGVAAGYVYDSERDLFSGLFRILRGVPERFDPLWTGMRHGLCRKGLHGDPYLLRYWYTHRSWKADDPRSIHLIAEVMVRFHHRCWHELAVNREKHTTSDNHASHAASSLYPTASYREEANIEAVGMLADLYRDIVKYLMREAINTYSSPDELELRNLPSQLLNTIHALVLQLWPASEAEKVRLAVIKAYDDWHTEMEVLTGKQENT